MEADACGNCNGNNSLATLVSDSSSAAVNPGIHILQILYDTAMHMCH